MPRKSALMEMLEIPVQFYIKNRHLRLKIILALLIAVLFAVFIIGFAKRVVFADRLPTASIIAVKCFKCGFCEDRLIEGALREVKCIKCGGAVGLHMKCSMCEYEFAFLRPEMDPNRLVGKSKFDRLQLYLDQQACPTCGSTQVETIAYTKK